MAESSSGSGGWWHEWMQTAKEKSAQAYELIKHDLQEFSQVCSQDASEVVTSTTHTLQERIQFSKETQEGVPQSTSDRVKAGITNILGGLSKVLTIPPDDESDDDVLRVNSVGNLEVFDKGKARLQEIQTSVNTYCNEPDGLQEKFLNWRENFCLEEMKGEISDLLVSVNEMRSIYTKLVPSAVSHNDFWERYFYKVYQLNLDEKRKEDLKKRADKMKTEQEETEWEDDWTEATCAEQLQQNTFNIVTDGEDKGSLSLDAECPINVSCNQFSSDENTPADCKSISSLETTSAPVNKTVTSNTDEHLLITSGLQNATQSDAVKVQEKGSYVMVGSDRETPVSSVSSSHKETSSLEDEWEKEFDASGLDMEAVQEIAKGLQASDKDDIDNWESWE